METASVESIDEMSDAEHGPVQGGECRLEVDETRERHAADEGESLGLLHVALNMEAGGLHLQATAEQERIVDWTQDLREIRRKVEFLVRRERKLDVKADVAVRRLARLDKEHSSKTKSTKPASRTPSQTGPKSLTSSWTRGSSTKASALAKSRQAKSSSSSPGRIGHANPGDTLRGKRRSKVAE